MELQRDVSTLDKCIGFYGNLSQVYNYNKKIDYELDAISKYTVFFFFQGEGSLHYIPGQQSALSAVPANLVTWGRYIYFLQKLREEGVTLETNSISKYQSDNTRLYTTNCRLMSHAISITNSQP